MGIRNTFERIGQWMAEREQARALKQFTCSHCDRSASCGRAPGTDCLEKLEQISAGDGWRYRQDTHAGDRRWE